jgi:hypothetical protein
MNPKNVRFELNVKNSIFIYPDERVSLRVSLLSPGTVLSTVLLFADLFWKHPDLCSSPCRLLVAEQVRARVRFHAKYVDAVLRCSGPSSW